MIAVLSMDENELIEEQAATWFVRVQDQQVGEAELRALQQWLAADVRHRHAWSDIAGVWQAAAVLETAPPPVHAAVRRATPRPWVALAASVLMIMVCGVWFAQPPGYAAALLADDRTAIGEHQQRLLADGSVVTLGAASALSVKITAQRREVQLLRGEAFFEVAAEPSRPFVVHAGGGSVEVLGTQFNVSLQQDSATVSVAQGKVAVAFNGRRLDLTPGQGARFGDDQLVRLADIDVQNVGFWRQGRLVFEARALRDVVNDLARYRGGRIIVDEAIATLPVSGVFSTESPEAALQTIVQTLPVREVSMTPYWRWLRAAD